MLEIVGVLLALYAGLATWCALFGDDERAKRGMAVLRELLSAFTNRYDDEGEK